MCPLWPFHVFFIYGSLLAPLWLLSSSVIARAAEKTNWGVTFDPTEVRIDSASWDVIFEPKELLDISMDTESTMKFTTTDLTADEIDRGIVNIVISDETIASISSTKKYILNTENISDNSNWTSAFNVKGNFLGWAEVYLQLTKENDPSYLKKSQTIPVTVVRPERVIDTLFTISVATLVSIIYINFGCALDWGILKKTIRRPLGPIIGFISQFLIMPLLSYGLGKVLFPSSFAMQIGMLFTGVSPAGGASNIWTFILGGDLNLSITMTTISTFAAFGMIPLWIFTLGQVIFSEGHLTIPYSNIATFAIGLVVPLIIGFLIQRYLPRLCKIMVRILKPFSALLILFIIIFATVTNLYLFQLFTWEIIIAGLGLPWLGYIFGYVLARLWKMSPDEVLAISLETGIQNTGIAIFLLRFSLDQPEADLTTVIPVAVAIMTPLPLMLMYIYCKCLPRWRGTKGQALNIEEDDKASSSGTEPFVIGKK